MPQCKDCGAPISFVQSPEGKPLPVDTSSLGEEDLECFLSGEKPDYVKDHHQLHFETCEASRMEWQFLLDKKRLPPVPGTVFLTRYGSHTSSDEANLSAVGVCLGVVLFLALAIWIL